MENFTLLPSSRDVVSGMCTSNRSAFLPLDPAVGRPARVGAGRVGRMGRKRRVQPGQVYLWLHPHAGTTWKQPDAEGESQQAHIRSSLELLGPPAIGR